MRRALFAIPIVFAACGEHREGTFALPMPDRLSFALVRGVGEIEAGAEIVPRGGAPKPRVALTRAEDGVSFSGFIKADPGDYTVEIVFTGLPSGSPQRLFLGRWISDAFTVARGAPVSATFSKPLDAIGRGEDGGDPDGDGLGNVDEILFGSDPTKVDSDSDQIPDGEDCDPGDVSRAFRIAANGSFLDCDGDGQTRTDPPFGIGGRDCNDKDAMINPNATDSCDDPIDSDCNPSTCPGDDSTPPSITDLSPAAESLVGCQARLTMRIRDDTRVAGVLLEYIDAPFPNGLARAMGLTNVEGDLWTTPALGLVAPPSGRQRIRIEATDASSNKGRVEHALVLAYDRPVLTAPAPNVYPESGDTFDVSITATAMHGLKSISLYIKSRPPNVSPVRRGERLLASVEGDRLDFTVDTSTITTGDFIVYPVVEDRIGNLLGPLDYINVTGGDEPGIIADYNCNDALSAQVKLPVWTIVKAGSSFTPIKMREALPVALDRARAVDPAARLTQITGIGVKADGTVALDSSSSYSPRWSFGFYNASTRRWIEVSWLSAAFNMMNPQVNPNAGNISSTEPLANVDTLVDSDTAVRAFDAAPGCTAPVGADDDLITYIHDSGQDFVQVGSMGAYWRGTAHAPITTVFGCN
jgi:hypothetical protein